MRSKILSRKAAADDSLALFDILSFIFQITFNPPKPWTLRSSLFNSLKEDNDFVKYLPN